LLLVHQGSNLPVRLLSLSPGRHQRPMHVFAAVCIDVCAAVPLSQSPQPFLR
jgi:hypothetical protein